MGGLNSYGNFNNCTVTLTLHMNMWHIVLLIIKIIHTNNQTIEHWYCWHSYIPQIKIKKIEQKKRTPKNFRKKIGHPKIFDKEKWVPFFTSSFFTSVESISGLVSHSNESDLKIFEKWTGYCSSTINQLGIKAGIEFS